MARLDSVLSFSRDDPAAAADQLEPDAAVAYDNGGSDDDDDAGFEFAFAPPLGRGAEDARLAPAGDLFAHGRILPAYPVFDRGQNDPRVVAPQTAPPSPDTYCAWAPRSAPGSPARDFPKSASTGEARRFWRLRGLVGGGGGRSHSDGKEKFVFLQPGNNPAEASKMPGKAKMMAKQDNKPSSAPPLQEQKQSKKKGKAGAVTEMDMATAHRLFYGKQGAPAGADRKQHSYLPYRTGIVGFFATAHALGRSHHPY